ncbi:MAG: sodium:solute symporter family protein [Acidobacteria bacterium]|nr:sodium:solute symporter family protein [Acidobacteriota bacterium]
MEEYFVAGRSFGAVLFYVNTAAEIYSAFAFLGLAGWAYAKGISIVYALAYGSIAYAMYFLLGPRVNRLGRRLGYVTEPDFLQDRYGSRALGVFSAAIGFLFILPYLQLQIVGTGMIIEICSGGAIGWRAAVLVSFLGAVAFVVISGLRGIGWTNLLQAVIMLVGMVALGIVVPSRLFGGVDAMFDTLASARPQHLVLPDSAGLGLGWYTSVVLLSGCGFWIWPQVFAATYAARDERVVRRNAAVLPLFQLALLAVIVVGMSCAALAARDPQFAAAVENPDYAMLTALVRSFPPLFVGLIGAGGVAAAISTASALILAAANLVARNVLQRGLTPRMNEMVAARIGRLLVPCITAIAMALAFYAPRMLVDLLLAGYSGIAQLFPAVVLGLFARWPTRAGVLAGLACGLALVLACFVGDVQLPWGIHPGLAGLLLNVLVVAAVSAGTRAVDPERVQRFERALSEPAAE